MSRDLLLEDCNRRKVAFAAIAGVPALAGSRRFESRRKSARYGSRSHEEALIGLSRRKLLTMKAIQRIQELNEVFKKLTGAGPGALAYDDLEIMRSWRTTPGGVVSSDEIQFEIMLKGADAHWILFSKLVSR